MPTRWPSIGMILSSAAAAPSAPVGSTTSFRRSASRSEEHTSELQSPVPLSLHDALPISPSTRTEHPHRARSTEHRALKPVREAREFDIAAAEHDADALAFDRDDSLQCRGGAQRAGRLDDELQTLGEQIGRAHV